MHTAVTIHILLECRLYSCHTGWYYWWCQSVLLLLTYSTPEDEVLVFNQNNTQLQQPLIHYILFLAIFWTCPSNLNPKKIWSNHPANLHHIIATPQHKLFQPSFAYATDIVLDVLLLFYLVVKNSFNVEVQSHKLLNTLSHVHHMQISLKLFVCSEFALHWYIYIYSVLLIYCFGG